MMPLFIQSDGSLLLDDAHPQADAARALLLRCAELRQMPGRYHHYRLTPLSLWQAAATGERAADLLTGLTEFAQTDLPAAVAEFVQTQMARYACLRLERIDAERLRLVADSADLADMLWAAPQSRRLLLERNGLQFVLAEAARGLLKQALLAMGHPIEDLAGYRAGAGLALALREQSCAGHPLALRPYQQAAVESFLAGNRVGAGSGVIVLPCGAGKTMVGIAVMARLACQTLILCPHNAALHQWIAELQDKTTLSADDIGEYSGNRKVIRPVTVATYQVLSQRRAGEYGHFQIFEQADWGLVIYDEVQQLPAPVFRATAAIQARRRLGLTATLLREDGREHDVFALIGPKRYELPWRELERQGWIARAECLELRLELPAELRRAHDLAVDRRAQYRIAAENPHKLTVLARLLAEHRNEQVLVIGQYLDQLHAAARQSGAILITGRTPEAERIEHYAAFRAGAIKVLILSKLANTALDLPEAAVAVQLSGSFGSRQEEAQRLGRLLRPKADGRPARFYSLVTQDSREVEFARHRQLFLVEQGYQYSIDRSAICALRSGQ
jgi:DNA excision repair protein ERCC-3